MNALIDLYVYLRGTVLFSLVRSTVSLVAGRGFVNEPADWEDLARVARRAHWLLRLQDWANEIGFEDMRPTWKFPRPLKNRRDRREAAEALRALNLARLVRFHAGLRTSLLG